jgi:hypothetical protein
MNKHLNTFYDMEMIRRWEDGIAKKDENQEEENKK